MGRTGGLDLVEEINIPCNVNERHRPESPSFTKWRIWKYGRINLFLLKTPTDFAYNHTLTKHVVYIYKSKCNIDYSTTLLRISHLGAPNLCMYLCVHLNLTPLMGSEGKRARTRSKHEAVICNMNLSANFILTPSLRNNLPPPIPTDHEQCYNVKPVAVLVGFIFPSTDLLYLHANCQRRTPLPVCSTMWSAFWMTPHPCQNPTKKKWVKCPWGIAPTRNWAVHTSLNLTQSNGETTQCDVINCHVLVQLCAAFRCTQF
jgi:hypothetical protein